MSDIEPYQAFDAAMSQAVRHYRSVASSLPPVRALKALAQHEDAAREAFAADLAGRYLPNSPSYVTDALFADVWSNHSHRGSAAVQQTYTQNASR